MRPENRVTVIAVVLAWVSIFTSYYLVAKTHPLAWAFISLLAIVVFGVLNKLVGDHYAAIEDAKDKAVIDAALGRMRERQEAERHRWN